MPLNKVKFKFLRDVGIKRKVASAHEDDFEAASGTGPDEIYREAESAVIAAVERLIAVSAPPEIIARHETDVTQVQRQVTGDDGCPTAEVLQVATEQLAKIKALVEECSTPFMEGGLMVGNRVYHEAEPGEWWSYDPNVRSAGISGEQFRSPERWFAELFAAFHCNVLKPTHPNFAWIQAKAAGAGR